MKIFVASKLFEQYPETQIGILVAKGSNNPPSQPEIVRLLGTPDWVRSSVLNFNSPEFEFGFS